MTTPKVNVRCFSHLGISVSDLDLSVRFYTEILGFVPRFENAEEGWKRVGLALGDIQLELFSPHPATDSRQPFDPFYPMSYGRPKIALTVDDVVETHERLVAGGIEPLCPVVTTPMSKFFFVADPDGTPIQLHEFTGGQQRVTELFV